MGAAMKDQIVEMMRELYSPEVVQEMKRAVGFVGPDEIVSRQRRKLSEYLSAVTDKSPVVDAVPKIVGFVGGIGSGKSYAADMLIDRFCFVRGSFADALKTSVFETLSPLPGVEWRHFFGTQEDKKEPIPSLGGACGRTVLEGVGTEGYRAVYEDVWVDLSMRRLHPNIHYVFDDVRYLNEARSIRSQGGVLIKLQCLDSPSAQRTGHKSDTEWEEIKPDFLCVARFGELDDLFAQVRTALFRRATD